MIFYDYSKLIGRIIEKFGTQAKFAVSMNLSERTVSLKLTNHVGWKQDEIVTASTLLDISLKEIPWYFFNIENQEDRKAEKQEKSETQQLIRMFRGKYIMLFRDFETITGVRLSGNYTSRKRESRLIPGRDYNGWGWECDNEKFRKKYGFDYGDDKCMMYLYPCGIRKALSIYTREGGKADTVQTIQNMMKAAGL